MSNKLDAFAKMFFDYTLTAVGTVAISPLLFYIAYRINKEDPGPIFFAHTRIGKDGKAFPCYKFRSMVVNSKEMLEKLIEMKYDVKNHMSTIDESEISKIKKYLSENKVKTSSFKSAAMRLKSKLKKLAKTVYHKIR